MFEKAHRQTALFLVLFFISTTWVPMASAAEPEAGARAAGVTPIATPAAAEPWEGDPAMVGMVPRMNVADLPQRVHREANFYPIDDYLQPEVMFYKPDPAAYADADPDLLPIDTVLRGILRQKPFPEVMYFKHVTDYYRRKAALHSKIEQRVEALPASDGAWVGPVENYAWLLLYLGNFQRLVDLFGPEGQYNPQAERSPSMVFALAQAYFRLGRYGESLPYATRAKETLEGSILDTRWQIMLTEMATHGRGFLDQPDSGHYTKKHIKTIFPERSWEAFPFEDVTERMGVDRMGGTGSISFVDLDLDGWDELVWERKFFPAQIYRNLEGRKFQPIPAEDLASPLGSPIIFTAGDVDNDGLPDLFRHCCNYDGKGPTQLLHNLGDLKFEDITESSGLAYQGAGMVTAWADYDLDGYLDIVIGDDQGPSRLYRNKGDMTFENVTEKAGVKTPRTVGLSWGDYDNDGWPDLWVLGWGSKLLYRNNGDGTFEDVTHAANIRDAAGRKGYMSFMFDYNNDGHLDLLSGQYVVSSDEKWGFGPICTCSNLLSEEGYSEREWKFATTIYHNNGDGTFTNIYEKTKFIPLGMMGSNHGDWNNDGYEDLLMGAGGPYFQQAEPFLFYQNNGGDGSFDLITPYEMLSLWGKGHGSAFSDFDHDGFLDVAANNGGASPGDLWPSLVLRNKGNGNHWLQVELEADGRSTNALSVGARVEVKAGGMTQVKEIQAGGQFGAVNSLVLHFGLAAATQVDEITVRWPNRKHGKTVLRDLEVDQRIRIFQTSGRYQTQWRRPVEAAE